MNPLLQGSPEYEILEALIVLFANMFNYACLLTLILISIGPNLASFPSIFLAVAGTYSGLQG